MIYFNVLGQHFLVLGSVRRTTDLFEKRSSNYSDRMRMTMVMDLYVLDFFISYATLKRFCLLQNEMGFQLGLSTLWGVVAKTEAIVSRSFPPKCGVQIYSDPKTRNPYFFASTTCHTRQLPIPLSAVSIVSSLCLR